MTKWVNDGVPDDVIQSALSVLHPTGIPFLDMCMWKTRFPSAKARFCTEELKVFPMENQVVIPALKAGLEVTQWLGVRWDESRARSNLVERERADAGHWLYRPILSWTSAQVFDKISAYGIEPNPLYKLGLGRVGCMPCIFARKAELLEIAKRFPEEIDRVRKWEAIVGQASRRRKATFFPSSAELGQGGIDSDVLWSKTSRGGRQLTIDAMLESPSCSSLYGLCE